jgi:peptide-methionine (S)-S-oxide reductase
MPQLRFGQVKGVVRCEVGYSGGCALMPTYRQIKDHTEALLIEFDPKIVGYDDLLIVWSRMHRPTRETKCQYRSAIWYLNEDQKEAAAEVLAGMQAGSRERLVSSVEKATRFYRAEEYHQDFVLKQQGGNQTNR